MEPIQHGSDIVESQQHIVAAAADDSDRQASIVHILGSHYPSNVLQLRCNTCSLVYGSLSSFRLHFTELHGLEPELEHFTIQTISETRAPVSPGGVSPSLTRETGNTSSSSPKVQSPPISSATKRPPTNDNDNQVGCRKVCLVQEPEAKSSPTLKHVIPDLGRDEGAAIRGLTVINNQLFVLRYPPLEELQVYETETFTQQGTVRVPISYGSREYMGLASCDVNNCLYVCDGDTHIYRVDLSTDDVTDWHVQLGCLTVSISASTRNVVVTCLTAVCEYTTGGQLVRTIALDQSQIEYPIHAVELTSGRFVVGHWEGVSVIDELGQVITTYGNNELVYSVQLGGSYVLAVTTNDIILSVNGDGGRLVALDSALSSARETSLPVDSGMVEMQSPFWTHYDESCRRLYVGEGADAGRSRIFIFDDINV